jgi:hypothetical protein
MSLMFVAEWFLCCFLCLVAEQGVMVILLNVRRNQKKHVPSSESDSGSSSTMFLTSGTVRSNSRDRFFMALACVMYILSFLLF